MCAVRAPKQVDSEELTGTERFRIGGKTRPCEVEESEDVHTAYKTHFLRRIHGPTSRIRNAKKLWVFFFFGNDCRITL